MCVDVISGEPYCGSVLECLMNELRANLRIFHCDNMMGLLIHFLPPVFFSFFLKALQRC